MSRIGEGHPFGDVGEVRRRAEEAQRLATERAAELARVASAALASDDPRGAEELARVLRELRGSAPDQRMRFLLSAGRDIAARIEQAFPPGSEERLRLGEALVRASGTDPSGVSRRALEAAVTQALAVLGPAQARPLAPPPRDVVERSPGGGIFGGGCFPTRPLPSFPGNLPAVSEPPLAPEPAVPASAPAASESGPPAPASAKSRSDGAVATADRQLLREALRVEKPAVVARVVPVERAKAAASSAPNDRRSARRASLRSAAEQAGRIEAQATLKRTALLEARGGFGERLAAREASPILERAALRAGVARELLAKEPARAQDFVLQATAARSELSQMRSELAALPEGVSSEELERAALAAEGELRMAVGREAIAGEGTPAFTEADLEKIGSGLDPSKPPPQTFWREDLVNTVCDLGLEQGGLSTEQANTNGDLVRTLLNPDGQVDLQGRPQELGPMDLAAALKMSGASLERVDPNQVEAASRYVNTATTVAEQQDKLRKALDNFHILERTGLPRLSRQQMIDYLGASARVPRDAVEKLPDAKLEQQFQTVLAAVNGGPGSSKVKLGEHRLELQMGERGEIVESKCERPSIWSRIGNAVRTALPIALTVASFIPVTMPFARVASAALSLYQSIRSRSVMGIASAGAALFGFGQATLGRAGNLLLQAGQGAYQAARAIRDRNWMGALSGVAGAVAAGVGAAATRAGSGLSSAAAQLGRAAGHLRSAAAGVGALQSYRSAGQALAAAREALAQATASGDARAISTARRQLEEAERAKRGAILGAVSTAAGVAGQYVAGDRSADAMSKGRRELTTRLGQMAQGLDVARAVNEKDYVSAGAAALGLGASVRGGRDLAQAAAMAQSGAAYHQARQSEAAAKAALDHANAQLELARRSGNGDRIRAAEEAVEQAERSWRAAIEGGAAAVQGLQSTAEQIATQRRVDSLLSSVKPAAPGAADATAPASPDTAGGAPRREADVYTLGRGGTVWEISMRTGVPVERILAFNAEQGNPLGDVTRLPIGQQILVPQGAAERTFTPRTDVQIEAMRREARERKAAEERHAAAASSSKPPDGAPRPQPDVRASAFEALRHDRALIAHDESESEWKLWQFDTWVDGAADEAKNTARASFGRAVDRLEIVLLDQHSTPEQIQQALLERNRAEVAFTAARGAVSGEAARAGQLTPLAELGQSLQQRVHDVANRAADRTEDSIARVKAAVVEGFARVTDARADVVERLTAGTFAAPLGRAARAGQEAFMGVLSSQADRAAELGVGITTLPIHIADQATKLPSQVLTGVAAASGAATQGAIQAAAHPAVQLYKVGTNDGMLVGAPGVYAAGTPISQIEGVKPRGLSTTQRIIYVNGIRNELSHQQASMQNIARVAQAEVIGIHNATDGWVPDALQTLLDKAGWGRNRAVDSLTDLMWSELMDPTDPNRTVNLWLHSQGGVVGSRALEQFAARLARSGLSRAEQRRVLGRINVETFAAASWAYIDGVNYRHWVNTLDPVPGLLGLGRWGSAQRSLDHPGKGAQMEYFTEFEWSQIPIQHGLDDIYLPNWRPPKPRTGGTVR